MLGRCHGARRLAVSTFHWRARSVGRFGALKRSRLTPKLGGEAARAGPNSGRRAGRLVSCSVSLGCTRAARREMLLARTAGGLAKDTASLRAPSSLLTSAFEPGRFLCEVPRVEAPHHPADDPPQEAGKRHGERHPGAVSRSRRLGPVIRFDRCAGRAADEPKASTRFERFLMVKAGTFWA